MKKLALFLVVMLAGVLPCVAGVTYTAVMRDDNPVQGKAVTQSGTIHGWASGQNGKVEFIGDANPMMPSGSYLVTRDGAKTLYLVDPGQKTYTVIDTEQMLGASGGMMQSMRTRLKMEIEAPKIERLIDENGGLVAGLPTRHYKYRTTYTMVINYMGAHKSVTTIEEDIWATTKALDPAMGLWLKKQPPSTGDEQMDSLIAAEMNKVSGFPLKRVSRTITESDGTKQIFRNEMEVTQLKVVPVPLSKFEIPRDYKEQKHEDDEDDSPRRD